MTIVRVAALVAVLLAGFSAYAQERDFSRMSAEELEALPREKIKQLPARLVFEKLAGGELKSAEALDAMFVFPLRALAYTDARPGAATARDIEIASRKFQADIGADATGVLSVGQFEELMRRHERLQDRPVYLPNTGKEISVTISGGYAQVEGTWVIEGDKIAWPINHNIIRCDRDRRECVTFSTTLDVPSMDSSNDAYNLHASINTASIVRWSNDEIVMETGSDCRSVLTTINARNNEVFEIVRNKGGDCSAGIVALPKLEKPRISRLVPGWKLSWDFWQERKKEAREYMSSEYRQALKELGDRLKKAGAKN